MPNPSQPPFSAALHPSLIVHGGAWTISADAAETCRAGCRRALEAGWKILSAGGRALDAVEAAVVALEDDPVFDAGTGSHLNLDGRVQLDAIVMDGTRLDAGAVAAVERIRNPIRLARRVLEASPHMMLVGEGAERFAAGQGMALCRPEELMVERERQAWSRCAADGGHHHSSHSFGTVGAVARDRAGNIAAATSTGGTCCKLPGRVGDSPLVGCGCYADSQAGGASCTGYGEAIMRTVLAKAAVDQMRAGGDPQEAAQTCVRELKERGRGTGGLILLDRHGRIGSAFNTPNMAWGHVAPDGSPVVSV